MSETPGEAIGSHSIEYALTWGEAIGSHSWSVSNTPGKATSSHSIPPVTHFLQHGSMT